MITTIPADECKNDPNKIEKGECGCHKNETDSVADRTPDCHGIGYVYVVLFCAWELQLCAWELQLCQWHACISHFC